MIVEIGSLLLIGLFIGISQAAGNGGGAIINVLLITGLGYNAKDSISITYIFLMGGGLASTIASIRKRNNQGRRLIDYQLIMITLPMMMSGAIFGTILNHFLSEMSITIIFLILIGYMIWNTLLKYREMKRQQSNAELKSQDGKNSGTLQGSDRLCLILSKEDKAVPVDKLKIILYIYAYTFVVLICRGGKTFDSLIGLEKCSIGSWVVACVHLLLSYLYVRAIGHEKRLKDEQKQNLGFVFEDPKDKMTKNKLNEGMFNGFLAGILGGAISIGGGTVLVPLWFRAGIQKNIALSSTGPLIFFSASVSFFTSALLGKYDSALTVFLYFALSFIGSYIVKNLVIHLTQKYHYDSLVLLLLIFIMGISLIVLLPVQYQKYISDSDAFMLFDTLC